MTEPVHECHLMHYLENRQAGRGQEVNSDIITELSSKFLWSDVRTFFNLPVFNFSCISAKTAYIIIYIAITSTHVYFIKKDWQLINLRNWRYSDQVNLLSASNKQFL